MSPHGRHGDRLLIRQPWAAIAVIAVAVVVLVVSGVHYSGGASIGPLDKHLDSWLIARFHGHSGPAHFLADIGDTAPVVLATVVVAAIELRLRNRRGAVLAVLSPLVAIVVGEAILKPAFARKVYYVYSGYSYPSGHATAACSVLFVIAVLGLSGLARARARIALIIGCAVVALAVAAGLVAAGYHYATDTFGGISLALITVLTLAIGLDLLTRHR